VGAWDCFEVDRPFTETILKQGSTGMPIHEFKCPNGRITEKIVATETKEIICPRCHQKAKKIISECTFLLKGSGWSADGYCSEKK